MSAMQSASLKYRIWLRIVLCSFTVAISTQAWHNHTESAEEYIGTRGSKKMHTHKQRRNRKKQIVNYRSNVQYSSVCSLSVVVLEIRAAVKKK